MASSGKAKKQKIALRKAKHAKKAAAAAAKDATRKARRERKLQKRLALEAAGVPTQAGPPQRSLLSTINRDAIDPDQIVSILDAAEERRKRNPELLKPVPPPPLFDLIHEFLKSYRYIKAAHGMRTDNQKRPGHNLELWVHKSEGYPTLIEIFDEWLKGHPEKVDKGAYAKGQEKRAGEKKALKEAKAARLQAALGGAPKQDQGGQAQTQLVDKSAAESESSSSEDDSGSESESSSESEVEDAMSVDGKPDIAATKPAKPASVAPAAATNSLKRKAPTPSVSSESESESSSSESEEESRKEHVAAPAKKKAKVSTPAAKPSSTSSESDSESDSSSASSSSGVAVSKPVKASAAVVKTAPPADPSSESSGSSSEEESEEESEDENPKATSTQPTSVSRSSSDSSATLPITDVVALQSTTISKAVRDASPSSTSASGSTSESSSSSDEDDSADDEAATKVAEASSEQATKPKRVKTPKPPKDTLHYFEPASKTQLKKDPYAVGPEKTVLATAQNFKNLKKRKIAFSRIPADVKVDERFSSNQYVPYDYANGAHNNLITTKGKGFTKAKNKGKRGSYKGGMIDLHGVRAVKFDD